MATRSLTDVFMLMRSNAIRNRNIFPDGDDSERMQLVSLNNDEEEGFYTSCDNRMPPQWIDYLDKAQVILPHLKTKISDLKTLQTKHLHKPTFDESSADEEAIESCTQEISQLFNEVHRLIQMVSRHFSEGPTKEQLLIKNVHRTLIVSLQDLSQLFKSTQNGYLREIKSREDRSNAFFKDQVVEIDMYEDSNEEIDSHFMGINQETQQLLQLEEESTQFALQREEEINSIVKSIVDVNKIFKELSIMVTDQGTVLDRIDYNVERTQIDVIESFKQLRKAEAYQRKNRKMCTIVVLAITTIFVFFVLVLIKF